MGIIFHLVRPLAEATYNTPNNTKYTLVRKERVEGSKENQTLTATNKIK